MNKNLTIICSILVLTILATAFQYVNILKSEIVDAYSAIKPANGHSWSEMECTSGLCVTSDNKVGIGTDSPSKKLEVNGDILASGTGDVCNGSGRCLSSVAQTNVLAGGTNPSCPTGQTIIMKGYNGTWYMGTNTSITSWSQVVCGTSVTTDGTPLLVNGAHTNKNCTDVSGTVVSSGSNNMCRFNSSSCPSGWTQYLNWSTTTPTQVSATSVTYCANTGGFPTCYANTGSHSWANTAPEHTYVCIEAWNNYVDNTSSYGSTCIGESSYAACQSSGSRTFARDCGSTGYATITQIGCY